MSLTYAALCAGYNGLGMGVQSVLGGRTCWVSEFDAHPSRILDFHWPDVPNLGDMTRIDWRRVEPVDVLEGGTPCQDLSHAGRRQGMTEGTRSNLWVQMREAIHVIRPKLVVWENVRGAFSAPADSGVEFCPGCVGGAGDGRAALRALGRVLGDLSDLGYDAWWYGLPASDVGACHGRFRVFVYATPADTRGFGGLEALERHGRGSAESDWRGVPDERDRDALRAGPNGGLTLLPTPAVNDMGKAYTPAEWDAWTARMKSEHGNGNGHGKSLAIEAQRLLPTPRTQNNENRQSEGYGGESGNFYGLVQGTQDWRQYDAAIRRAERATGRPAPAPTETGPQGKPRLSPAFVEWMMMLPAGHVTNPAIWDGMTDGRGRVLTGDRLTSAARNAQLKALGNGVVPAQAAAATRMWLRDLRAERAA